MDNRNASVEEGKELAHLYDGAKDLKKVDQQVHDRLLQDAIKYHHSELDLPTVTKSMVDESSKINNKAVTITEDQFGLAKRENKSFPLLTLIDNGKLYDPIEGSQAVAKDDAAREAAKAQKDGTKINFMDGAMGIPTLFNSILNATDKK